MTTPEGKIKARLDRMLKEEGLWFFSPQAGPYGVSGIPDRIVILCGRFLGVEVKADESKKLTRLQEACRDKILAAGGFWFRVHDEATISDLRIFIRASYPEPRIIGIETRKSFPRYRGYTSSACDQL